MSFTLVPGFRVKKGQGCAIHPGPWSLGLGLRGGKDVPHTLVPGFRVQKRQKDVPFTLVPGFRVQKGHR